MIRTQISLLVKTPKKKKAEAICLLL